MKKYVNGRKRTEFIAFYVTKEEKEIIYNNAMEADQTISDYCRKKLTKIENVKEKQEG